MSRRVLPCGLGGVIGGHQGACWPLLSGHMALLRWFLGLPLLDLWSSLSLLRLQPVFCAGVHGPRLASSVRIRLCFIRLSPLSGSVPERVWCLALILAGSEVRAAGYSWPALPASCIALFSLPGSARCAWADLPANCCRANAPFCVCNYASK